MLKNEKNLSNECLIAHFNRFYHFTINIQHLESQLMEEFNALIKNDLKIEDYDNLNQTDE